VDKLPVPRREFWMLAGLAAAVWQIKREYDGTRVPVRGNREFARGNKRRG
jgi:hypothetical protein